MLNAGSNPGPVWLYGGVPPFEEALASRLPIKKGSLGAVFLVSNLTCSQSGNDQQEYLAKSGYKLNVKVKF